MVFVVGLGCTAQTFNKRFDLLGMERPQIARGIESIDSTYIAISFSFDIDTISVDSVVQHNTIGLTYIDQQGEKSNEIRYQDLYHGWHPGWSNCCDLTFDGGLVIGGSSNSYNQISKVLLLRLDPQGDTIWSKQFGADPAQWLGYQVKECSNGGFVIAGLTDAANGSNDGMVLRTDAVGNELWHQIYGGSQFSDLFVAVEEIAGGDFILGGISLISSTNTQMWVIRVDSLGNEKWQKKWGSAVEDPSAHIATSSDGHIVVASAWGYAPDGTISAPYMAKIDSSDGTIIWDFEYGEPKFGTTLFEVKECSNLDLIACGVLYENITQKGLLLRTNSQGDSLWMRTYFFMDSVMNNGTGRLFDVIQTPDGGFVATGAAYNPDGAPYPPGYSRDTWVIKVDSMGCIVPGCDITGVEEVVTNLSDALSIWPNPVQSGGTINGTLELPAHWQVQHAELTFVDGQGRVVLQQAPNGASFILPLPELSSGLYYLHLSDGKRWLSGTKVLIE